MSRTRAFLLPPIALAIGVPVIDKRGRRGVVVDVWYSKEKTSMRVKVVRARRYDGVVRANIYPANEVRVDLTTDMGFVHALREYLRLANAKVKSDVKAYAWTWGGLHEQAVKWWAGAIRERDERELTKMLLKITKTEEH